jgi:hypothetical protein
MPDETLDDLKVIFILSGGLIPLTIVIYLVNAMIEAGTDIPVTLGITLSILKAMFGLTIGLIIIILGWQTLKKNEKKNIILAPDTQTEMMQQMMLKGIPVKVRQLTNITPMDRKKQIKIKMRSSTKIQPKHAILDESPKSRSRMMDDETDI